MSDPKKYTVGWICAVLTEYVAGQAFLDEKHAPPDGLPGSENDYTLGRIGKHNVVMSVLPMGSYGTTHASRFPESADRLDGRHRGGVPSKKHDIRLGDIVVSIPGSGQGGVFQYDFGKAIQGQGFQNTSFLNEPPAFLRAAVQGLAALYEEEGHDIEGAISKVLQTKGPKMRSKYKRPDASTDRLYKSAFVHQDDDASCSSACGDDPTTLIQRPVRTEEDDNPAIHYGLIASGNELMKDALIRDELAQRKDVLCFEMEAAGLMNSFPCLVIRGICDYSDSHKNKVWQGYAAMAAAAYAKDLLYRVPVQKVEAETRIAQTVQVEQQHIHFGNNNKGVQIGVNEGDINGLTFYQSRHR
ncbi:hypothetical protein N7470_009787 [Penicillium chermesinum]|nr:hypothetical protein N7470_009787 [Penicillium chermesinum]